MGAPLLATDGYKFSMADAGWPLRPETFYLSHRKGGLQVLPFDVEQALKDLLPVVGRDDFGFLARNEYEMGSAFRAAMLLEQGRLQVRALPKFSVFGEREPIMSISGPSALVSWLEPLVLQWSYRIQVATLALLQPGQLAEAVRVVTCQTQKRLVEETLDAVGVKAPPIEVESEAYVARVRARVTELAELVGTPARLFEVGLRAATCLEQHLLALEGCKLAGLTRTSNVYGALEKTMVPVGTMGHEHVQRFGSDDLAFRAMIERRYQRSSFLLDTFDTITSGLPAAFAIIQERAGQGDSIRYDSGDKEQQYRHAVALARSLGIRPVHILEDGFDAAQTRHFEALRRELGVKETEQVYGYGGYLVAQTSGSVLTRDRVAAVYKLSQTGHRPTMKFADDGGAPLDSARGDRAGGGKQSIPGRPVVFRRCAGASGPFGIVGQEGERVPEGYALLSGERAPRSLREELAAVKGAGEIELSAQTRALVTQRSAWRDER